MSARNYVKEITFRQVGERRWEAILTSQDGTTQVWAGTTSGPDFDWDRPPMELPADGTFRELGPGPDLHISARLHLQWPTQEEWRPNVS